MWGSGGVGGFVVDGAEVVAVAVATPGVVPGLDLEDFVADRLSTPNLPELPTNSESVTNVTFRSGIGVGGPGV